MFTQESNAFLGGQYTVADWTECTQTDTQTKVKTVHPPVSLRSLGGYKYAVVRPIGQMMKTARPQP